MDSHLGIDYESLVEAYKESLSVTLRGFRPAAEFLDTWVYDEDDLKSIFNIIEAADDAGVAEISIHIGQATLRNLNLARLHELAGRFGKVNTRATSKGLVLHVIFTKVGRETNIFSASPEEDRGSVKPGTVHPHIRSTELSDAAPPKKLDRSALRSFYLEGVHQVLQFCSHEGPLGVEPGFEFVEISYLGTTLRAVVESSTHVVRKAAFQGALSNFDRGVMEMLCRFMEGKPIGECGDHAAIYVEYNLRDHSKPHPVPGIVTPENSDPAFARVTLIVRRLVERYHCKTGFMSHANFYSPPPTSQWASLPSDEKIKRIQAAIESCPDGDGMRVVCLEGAKRVIVKFHEEPDNGTKPGLLMKLENHLKTTTEGTLELYLEPKLDQNKVRRIKEAGAL